MTAEGPNERKERLYTSVDVHLTEDTEIQVRKSGGPGILCIGTPAERVALHLWGGSAKKLLRVLQEAKVDEWKEVTL